MALTLFITSIVVALCVSFLCSLSEATLLSLTPVQVADISSQRPKLGAVWRDFKNNIQRPIAVILLLNTSANAMGAAVAGAQVSKIFGDRSVWVFSILFTLMILQFGEILPKTLGVRFNKRLAGIITRPLNAAITLLSPLLHLLHLINRPLEPKHGAATRSATLEDISALAGLARLSKEIGAYQERIIKGAFRLSHLPVRQVMIPVDQVSFLSTSQTLVQAVLAAHMDTHTRFPVREGDDSNQVLGYINFKEMIYFMRTNPNDPSLKGIIRPVYFASPELSAADLLKAFVEQHVHMAIVRDESGKTLGLVTLEDLVEELVGELEDEFDRLPRMLHPLSGGIWMVGGGVPALELSQKLGVALPDCQGTTADWLAHRLNRMPKAGDTYKEAGLEFLVRRVRRGKVFEVAVSKA